MKLDKELVEIINTAFRVGYEMEVKKMESKNSPQQPKQGSTCHNGGKK